MIKIYTDGSCLENPGNGGWAAIIIINKEKKIISGSPDKIKTIYDTWTFSRDMRSNNPNWLLVNTLN